METTADPVDAALAALGGHDPYGKAVGTWLGTVRSRSEALDELKATIHCKIRAADQRGARAAAKGGGHGGDGALVREARGAGRSGKGAAQEAAQNL